MKTVLIQKMALTLLLSFVISACGGGDPVARYCEYGSVSQAQLDGCESHVAESDFSDSNTDAARYARGELLDCLANSGPFCNKG